jgi:hypothetical protein
MVRNQMAANTTQYVVAITPPCVHQRATMQTSSLAYFPQSPLHRAALYAFLLLVGLLSILAGARYPGSALIFASFALFGNAVLLNGFRAKALFFDTFIGLFLWLGFYLKVAIRLAFFDGRFVEAIGAFDSSGAAWDRALIVTSLAFAALLLASTLRQRFFSYPSEISGISHSGLYRFYLAHRTPLLVAFISLIVVVAVTNVWLGVYQRGMITRTVLPFGLNGIYKWLLQFGLASVSALLIRFEIERARNLTLAAVAIPLLECFASNLSLLSRGMILNGAGLGLGALRLIGALKLRISLIRLGLALLAFALLFGTSVYAVNYLRAANIISSHAEELGIKPGQSMMDATASVATDVSKRMFIDRWVGIEGVLAVSSANGLGWELWREAWREKFQEGRMTLYDSRFIDSPYKYIAPGGSFHFVSLPGMVAFLFYPGSHAFLAAAVLGMALLAALLEIACFRFCGRNLVLCSLLAQVLAFRYASFGYVPSQSYLLLGTLIANGVLIAGADALLMRWYARKALATQQ